MRLLRHGCEGVDATVGECEAQRAISVRFRYLILWRRRCWRLDVAASQLAKARYFRPADLVGKKRGYVFALIMIVDISGSFGAR